jgi:hypothetical protein
VAVATLSNQPENPHYLAIYAKKPDNSPEMILTPEWGKAKFK